MRIRIASLALLSALVAAAPAHADPYHLWGSWGLGLRASSQKVSQDFETEEGEHLAGLGIQGRYRFADHWSVELTLEALASQRADGNYQRVSVPITASVMLHLFGRSRWDLYALAGIGGTGSVFKYRKVDGNFVEEQTEESHVHLGIGLERHFGRLGLGAELRAVGLARSEESPTDAVPETSSAAQFNLALTYYF